jgi:predicted AAA+ superfamily ATPase
MERSITEELLTWKDDPRRKPLILRGMRQCGKTWVLKDFGRRHYRNLAYLSFDEHPEYGDFFKASKDPTRIVHNLAIALRQPIDPGETLLVLDEIQECPEALAALKYFQEKHPEYHVACAGSLLGIRLGGGVSFPVGKIDFLALFPLTFSEFLRATGDGALLDHLSAIEALDPLPAPFFTTLYERLKLYLITGGMPEAVAEWLDRGDVDKLERVLNGILASYRIDFAKHLPATLLQKATAVWDSLPAQLSKENKKFRYNIIKNGASAREYGEALSWLCDAQLVHQVNRAKTPGLPLSAHDDPAAFKLYAADVGLLRQQSHLDPSVFAEGDRLFTEFKGALVENFVLQSLAARAAVPLRYWSVTNPNHEVDFILQHKNALIPIEVKAGADSRGKSLAAYKGRFSAQTPLRVRCSLLNLKLTDDLLNIPLFLVDQTPRLINLALEQQHDSG